MIAKLPIHTRKMRIGLLGGSFNPAHEGHRLISLIALKRLKLDRIWWIATPGNPLKDNKALPSQALRMVEAQKIAHHPRIIITGFESQIGTRYTYDTIAYLKRHCPQVRFIWLMGADNLSQFHQWQNWRDIAHAMPIAVIDRPSSTLRATSSRAAIYLQKYRMSEREAGILANRKAPAWIFLHGLRSNLSSTVLRKNAN